MTDTKGPAIGVIGEQVVRNMESLREARGYSFRDLAARLGAIGRPILPSALHSVSQRKRRIDADDLVALAIALGVNTDALLLPRDAGADDLVELTPAVRQRAWVVWSWAQGGLPLPHDTPGEGVREIETGALDAVDFQSHALPMFRAGDIKPAVREIHALLSRVLMQIEDFGNPATFDYRAEFIGRALQRVQLEVGELLAESARQAQRSAPSPTIAEGDRG